ncbi:hypothetical protein EXT65_20975 [Pectobacterium carotovorum subsp. carotovorum]|nr:hypothetical protein [Pectobacterium carotovorum]MCL6336269.1 hypothetical protein [Pectobacterium carotovorum subsp. carotovorum]
MSDLKIALVILLVTICWFFIVTLIIVRKLIIKNQELKSTLSKIDSKKNKLKQILSSTHYGLSLQILRLRYRYYSADFVKTKESLEEDINLDIFLSELALFFSTEEILTQQQLSAFSLYKPVVYEFGSRNNPQLRNIWNGISKLNQLHDKIQINRIHSPMND